MVRERIHELLAQRGITIAELGRRIGVSRSRLSRMLDGHSRLDVDLLPALATALGVDIEQLVGQPGGKVPKSGNGRYISEHDLEVFWLGLPVEAREYLAEIDKLRRRYRERQISPDGREDGHITGIAAES